MVTLGTVSNIGVVFAALISTVMDFAASRRMYAVPILLYYYHSRAYGPLESCPFKDYELFRSHSAVTYTSTVSDPWRRPRAFLVRTQGRGPQASHQRIRRVRKEELYPGGTRPGAIDMSYVTGTFENEAVEIWSLIGVAGGEDWLYCSVCLCGVFSAAVVKNESNDERSGGRREGG